MLKNKQIAPRSKQEIILPWLNGIGAQQKCFERADKNGHTFYAVKQIPYNNTFTNTYNSFEDIKAFIKFTDNWVGHCYFNELIREGTPCVEYYDIDGKWTDGWESIDDCLLQFIKLRLEYANSYMNTINKIDVRWDHMIVTEACNNTKLSLHIIINKPYFFNNTKDLRIWGNSFSDWIKIKHPESKIKIDTSVYNNNSIMRIVDNCKVGQESRPLKPYGIAKNITDKTLFYCSRVEKYYGVIGQVSYLYNPIDVKQPEETLITPIIWPTFSDEDELNTCKEFIKIFKPERSFEHSSWFSIGSALHNILKGSKEGLDLFLKFSSVCKEKYNENECILTWSKFKQEYSKGTLIHYYNEDKIFIERLIKKRKKKITS